MKTSKTLGIAVLIAISTVVSTPGAFAAGAAVRPSGLQRPGAVTRLPEVTEADRLLYKLTIGIPPIVNSCDQQAQRIWKSTKKAMLDVVRHARPGATADDLRAEIQRIVDDSNVQLDAVELKHTVAVQNLANDVLADLIDLRPSVWYFGEHTRMLTEGKLAVAQRVGAARSSIDVQQAYIENFIALAAP